MIPRILCHVRNKVKNKTDKREHYEEKFKKLTFLYIKHKYYSHHRNNNYGADMLSIYSNDQTT